MRTLEPRVSCDVRFSPGRKKEAAKKANRNNIEDNSILHQIQPWYECFTNPRPEAPERI